MKRIAPAPFPRKREQRLVIDELPDEILVYDLDRHRVHCLNQTAALVWQQCDGKSTAAQIAQRLAKKLQAPCNEDLVWLALRQLERLHLLEQSILLPAQLAGITRREMVRTIGIAAVVAVPMVTSIVSPRPAEAASCAGSGQSCGNGISCCEGVCSNSHCVP